MSDRWKFLCEVDCPEPRVLQDRVVVSADGTSWSMDVSSDTVWIDPITSTAMLRPLPLSPSWATTATGAYARLQKSSYSLPTPSEWIETQKRLAADYYLESDNNEKATTTATWAVNTPAFLSVFVPGNADVGKRVVIKFGWGVEDAAGSVHVQIRADGSATVYKSGSIVGQYDVEVGANQPGKLKGAAQANSGRLVEILALPCRARELLVVLSTGTGFSHVFADLNAFSSNTITPSAAFWWQCPSTRAVVQCAPCRFETAGNLFGRLVQMPFAPATGTTFANYFAYDDVGNGTNSGTITLVDSSYITFSANGIRNTGRVKVALAGDSYGSPGVYSVDLYSDPTTTTTANAPVDITTLLHTISIAVPRTGPVTVNLAGFDPQAFADAGMEQPETTGDRPFRIAVGGTDIVRGTLAKPGRSYGDGLADGYGDELSWSGTSRQGEGARRQFRVQFPYDGLALTDVLTDLMKLRGLSPSDYFISADAFVLPYTPAVSMGKWELMPERGDTVGQWEDKIVSDYAGTWEVGDMPTPTGYKTRFVDPATLGTSPDLTLYQSIADAVSASGGNVAPGLAPYRVIRAGTFRVQKVSAECNQVIVIGRDPGTTSLVTSQYDDAASQDPTTAPASRPANWRGSLVTFQLVDPAITSQAAADRARDILVDRLTTEKIEATWGCDILIKDSDDRVLWKTDVVRIYNPLPIDGGTGLPTLTGSTYDDFRIVAIPKIEVVWQAQAGTRFDIRDCEYVGELI